MPSTLYGPLPSIKSKLLFTKINIIIKQTNLLLKNKSVLDYLKKMEF